METIVDNQGVALSLTMTGDGPDLLFVHGLGSAQVLWAPLITSLPDRYRCWNLDLRGHGRSARSPGAYRASDYGSDVAAALDHIGRPTIGIGHSLGGTSLVRVGTEAHRNLRAVYALDSPILRSADARSSSAGIFEAQLAMLREFQPEARPVSDYEKRLAAAPYVGGGTNADAMVPAQLHGRAESLSQLDPECIESVLAGHLVNDLVPPSLTIPMRIIAADPELGAAFRPEWCDELTELTPHVEVETMTGVGHQLMMIRGYDTEVKDDLFGWLGRLG